MRGQPSTEGRIAYLEIPAIRQEDSATFYQSVFGWHPGKGAGPCQFFDDGIHAVAGAWIEGRIPARDPGVLVSIMVDSVADTCRLINENKGTVLRQAEIAPGLFIAWFSDPAGNVLGIYEDPGNGQGKICYLEIPAGHISSALGFYKAVFPWNFRTDDGGHASFDDSAGIVSGMWTAGRKPSAQAGMLAYITSGDLKETARKLTAAGGAVVAAPDESGKPGAAFFRDPSGNLFGLCR